MTHASRYRLVALSLAVVMTLSGCNVKRPERVDGKVALNDLPSPDVKGVGDTLEGSAKEALAVGDYKRANDIYHQLVDKDEKNVVYLAAYAETGRKSERFGAAIDAYDKLLKIDPTNLDAQEGKGLALMSKGDFTAASDVLGKVQEKDPKRWRTLNGLGILFVTRNMLDEAMAYFTEALTQSQNNVSVLNNVGLTLAIKKETKDATEALELASSLVAADDKRTKERVDMNLALVYGIAGDLDKAEKVASRYLDGIALNNNLGFYAYLAKDDMLAKSYLNMALAGSSHYYERAWKNLALVDRGKTTSGHSVNGLGSVVSPKSTAMMETPVVPSEEIKIDEKPAPAAIPAQEVKAAPSLSLPKAEPVKKAAKQENKKPSKVMKKDTAKKEKSPEKASEKKAENKPEPKPVVTSHDTAQHVLKLPDASAASAKKEESSKEVTAMPDAKLDLGLFKNAFGTSEAEKGK